MKLFLIVLHLIAFHIKAQNPFDHTRWMGSCLIGIDKVLKFDAKAVEITFITLDEKRPYGYITEFLADNQFLSYNQGWCGNECRMQVKGTYTVTGNTVELFVISISYSKDCNGTPTQVVNTSLGIYRWEQEETQLLLKPVEK